MQGNLHDYLFTERLSVKVKMSHICVSASLYPPILNWSISRRLIHALQQRISNPPHLFCCELYSLSFSLLTLTSFIWNTSLYFFTFFDCHYISHSSSVSSQSVSHSAGQKQDNCLIACVCVCVCVCARAPPFSCAFLCAGVTTGDSEQWFWLRSGCAAVVYMLVDVYWGAVYWCVCVCVCRPKYKHMFGLDKGNFYTLLGLSFKSSVL